MKLDKLRKKIDQVDRKIIDLVGQRLAVVKKISEIKKKDKIPVTDKKRETEVMAKIRSYSASNNISVQLAESIFRLIIKENKRVQKL